MRPYVPCCWTVADRHPFKSQQTTQLIYGISELLSSYSLVKQEASPKQRVLSGGFPICHFSPSILAPAPGYTYAHYGISTPAPGLTYAAGNFPTYVPGLMPTTTAPNGVLQQVGRVRSKFPETFIWTNLLSRYVSHFVTMFSILVQ